MKTPSQIARFIERHPQVDATPHEDGGVPWLDVSEPAVLANFVAFCKTSRRGRGRSVFLRGQRQRYPTMVPSLFRLPSLGLRAQRWAAYQDFLERLPALVHGTRFTKRNFGAVLQHYGFRTPWLDVVDDLHTAIWFALNQRESVGSECTYRSTTGAFGWVLVIAMPPGGHIQNLREDHSSMNSRCNVQQGYSLAMQYDDVDEPHVEQDFITSVVGTVRIPNNKRWQLRGFRSSESFFFPSPDHDNTYKQLLAPAVKALAESVERTHGLEKGALGHVSKLHGHARSKRHEKYSLHLPT